jgi:hypothetical protein
MGQGILLALPHVDSSATYTTAECCDIILYFVEYDLQEKIS